MTSDDVDFDRLADYVGGALDGTSDEDAVRHLVATDPRWSHAHAELVAAVGAVRVDLATLGAAPASAPADVVARLDATFRPAGARPSSNVVPLAGRRSSRPRWATALATAAAVVVCGFVGVTVARSVIGESVLPGTALDSNEGSDTTASSGGGAPPAALPANGGVFASGNNYRADSLGALSSAAPGSGAVQTTDDGRPGTKTENNSVPGNVPVELARLTVPANRAACLNAIVREYGGTVVLVDYARYEGAPSLLVGLDGTSVGAGRRLVVVVGPTCGENNAIADERDRRVI